MSKVHVKTGDTVIVLSGKDKGKTGQVMAVSPKEGKVIVEKVNMVSKHVKPKKMGEQGGIIKAEGARRPLRNKLRAAAVIRPWRRHSLKTLQKSWLINSCCLKLTTHLMMRKTRKKG